MSSHTLSNDVDAAEDQERHQQYASDLVLNEAKLAAAVASGQGHIFLIQWLAKVEKVLLLIERDAMVARIQPKIQSSLLGLVESFPADETAAETRKVPKLGRPARHLVARCLIVLFQRGDPRSVYDIGQSLLRIAADENKAKPVERESRTAALYVLGELFAALGHNCTSLFADIVGTMPRILKVTSNAVIIRFHALCCLQKALRVGAKSLSDIAAKDLVKALRNGLSDKAGAVVRGCGESLVVMAEETSFLTSRSEIEGLLSVILKEVEHVDYITKRALAKLAATLLASSQCENSAPIPDPSKRISKKKAKDASADDDSEGEQAISVAAAASLAAAQQVSTNGDLGVQMTGALYTPQEMLDLILQPFARPTCSRKLRIALLDIFATVFTVLGISWVQSNYSLILKVLIQDIPDQPKSTSGRSEVLCVRTGVLLLLRKVIGERMLGEQAQVLAVRELCSSYINRYSVVMPGQPPPPSKYTLVIALNEVSSLLHQLGIVPFQIMESLYEPLLRCFAHSSHSVQVAAAWCLRTLCYVQPTHLSHCTEILVERLSKDLQTLIGSGEPTGVKCTRRAVGHARGLAAVIGLIASRPQFASFDVSARVMDMAVNLLKNCGNHALPISGVEIQIAWTLLSALMSLGPNFVRLQFSQLMTLWRGSLPKPDSHSGQERSETEWAFLLHTRESTLSCIFAFLTHNRGELLNLDTARRIVALLSNTLAFADDFSSLHPTLPQEQVPGGERAALTLLDREHMLRRRLFQCFFLLRTSPAIEPLQDGLLIISLQTFAQPECYVGSAAQALIAASAGTFTSLWAMADAYAFGVTSLHRDEETFIGELAGANVVVDDYPYAATNATARADFLNRDSIEVQIDALHKRPVLGAAEHDPLVLCARYKNQKGSPPLPSAPSTAMVDAAVELFAALLPFQKRQTQIIASKTMLKFCRSHKLQKNPGRRAAVQINACVASLGALKVTMQGRTGIGGAKATGFNNDRMTNAMREILRDALLDGDSALRAVSSETYGRLAAVAGSHAMSSQVQFLVDQVVSNRDPDARAGCALAFGATYREVGGLSAGPLTKTVVNVLISLSSDPHPTVHYAALKALRMVIDAASLSYGPYVSSTLGMLVKLTMQDSHEPEGGSAGSANLRADLPAHQAICQVISGLIGVLGPDLQEESGKVRDLIYILMMELAREKDDGVVVEATKAIQHFCLFAPEQLNLREWITQLSAHLRSRQRPRKVAAVNGFYQLVQRQALSLSKIGGDALVSDLFMQLDLEPGMDGVREVLLSWLRKTAQLSPGSWIDLCQRIVNRNVGGQASRPERSTVKTKSEMLQDEEAATLNVGEDAIKDVAALQGCRWRTQLFALHCLHEVFAVVRRSGRFEHFESAANGGRDLMSSRITDLIRMAFTASTAANSEIRVQGLVILRDVITNFQMAKDPEFEEALLLEQYQAPIAAALTPAFSADSTPEVLATAIEVCAIFVGSGVVREVDQMGRILKQLVSALESCKDPEMSSLADVKDLSPNAAGMLKIAVFTAWSELTVASVSQKYLAQVVKPHLDSLVPYWIACLHEFAKIKADPQGSSIGLGASGSVVVVNPILDSEYAGLAREILLPHYLRAWPQMLKAVAVLMDITHPAIIKGMDSVGRSADSVSNSDTATNAVSAFRSDPCEFFFGLYGLAFEALATSSGASGSTAEADMLTALHAARSLCDPSYAGAALLQEPVFMELCNLCQRLVMTEGPRVQSAVMDLVATVALRYNQRLLDGCGAETAAAGVLASVTEESKLSHLLRIVVLAITYSRHQPGPTQERVALLRTALTAFGSMSDLYPTTVAEDFCAVAWFLHSELLRDEQIDGEVASGVLATLRDLCERSNRVRRPGSDVITRALHGFMSLAVNHVQDLRSRSGQAANSKTRSCLVALTVVLTHLPPQMSVSREVLDQFCYLIIQLLESAEAAVALTAANCSRTLLQASWIQATPWLRHCVGQLLPGLVCFTIKQAVGGRQGTSNKRDGEQGQRLRATAVLETLKSLENLCLSSPESIKPRMLGIVLPALITLLGDNDKNSGGSAAEDSKSSVLHQVSVGHLLTLATQSPAAFKHVTTRLEAVQRATMEASLRGTVASRGNVIGVRGGTNTRGGEASIALKSFGAI